jgi:DNA-binding NtrC family response regulator
MRPDAEEIRVLVVDDEHTIADTLCTILNRSGYTTRVAYGGEEAVRIGEDWRPMILISDLVMPQMNGVQVGKAILRSLPACRVILFSGHATVDMFHEIRAESFEILAKPVHPDVLLQKLSEIDRSRRPPEAHW